MKKIMIILALLMLIVMAKAETDGDRGFQMLRILTDPATAGQAGSGAIFSESGFSFLDNAAAPLLNKVQAVSFSQNMWLFDTSMSNIGYRNSNGKKSFGFAIRYLDYGKIDIYNEQGEQVLGEYHPMDLNLVLNLGYRIAGVHYIGANLRGLYEKIDDSSSTGISADIGYIYKTPLEGLTLMGSVENFGITSKMDEENISLPVTFELGINKEFDFRENHFSAEARVVKDIDNEELKAAIGTEYVFNERFFLRAGYKMNYELETLSCGFGVRLRRIDFNYAYNPISEDLDDVHYIGLNLRFR